MKFNIIIFLIFTVSFVFFLSVPLYFQYMGVYASPTTVYSQQIINSGKLVNSSFLSPMDTHGISDVNLESEYPLPSIILAMFAVITGIPQSYLMFIPISGFAGIIYFVLARRILSEQKNAGLYALLFALIYFIYTMVDRIHATYAGRATFGVVMLAFFFFCFSLFLYKGQKNNLYQSPLIICSCIFAVVAGYTYYSSTLAIVAITLIVFFINLKFLKGKLISFAGLSIALISIFLFVQNMSALVNSLNLNLFADNLIGYVRIRLTSGTSQLTMYYSGLVNIDSLTQRLMSFSSYVIFGSMIAIIISLIKYRPKVGEPYKLIWIFSLMTLIAGASELVYVSVTPMFPTRFFVIFGLIILFYIIIDYTKNTALKTHRLKIIIKKLFVILIIAIVIFASVGILRYGWIYGKGGAKPFAYSEIQPLSEFVSVHSSNQTPVAVTGDAYYIANMFCIISSHGDTKNVISRPLGQDTISLYYSSFNDSNKDFLMDINKKGINYILIVQNDRPLWGDDWGYTVPPPNMSFFYKDFTIVYNNGLSQLYGT